MRSLFELAVLLATLPMLGGFVLMVAHVAWQQATASATPRWQTYLWFLAVGYVLLNLREVAGRLHTPPW